MPQVIALEKGFDGTQIRVQGEKFSWPEGKKLGRWVELVGKPVAAPAPETVEQAEPLAGPETDAGSAVVSIAADWHGLAAPARKALAKSITGLDYTRVADADAVIEAEVERRKPAPFSDAPAPEVAGNGLQAALGGVDPDWVPPPAQAQE